MFDEHTKTNIQTMQSATSATELSAGIHHDPYTGVATWYTSEIPSVAAMYSEIESLNSNWATGETIFRQKRKTIFGRRETRDEKEANYLAKGFFKLIKKGLTKQEEKEFQKLAEKAFEEAIKALDLGMKDVSQKFEKEMTRNLDLAAIKVSGYDKFISTKQIDKFRNDLPSNKELVIDEIDEYEKPLPRKIQQALKKAQKAKCFNNFFIFWIRKIKDPILFGTVNGMEDRYYFIAEWAKDLEIKDFLKY